MRRRSQHLAAWPQAHLRDAPARLGRGSPRHPGTPRPRASFNDADLYPGVDGKDDRCILKGAPKSLTNGQSEMVSMPLISAWVR